MGPMFALACSYTTAQTLIFSTVCSTTFNPPIFLFAKLNPGLTFLDKEFVD